MTLSRTTYGIFLIFNILTFALSCGTKPPAHKTASEVHTQNCLPVTVKPLSEIPTDWTKARILSATLLEPACLAIHYQYSGCRQGEPRWIWDGQEPLQPILQQLYVAEAGYCEMLLHARDTFSLSNWLQAADGEALYLQFDSGEIVIDP